MVENQEIKNIAEEAISKHFNKFYDLRFKDRIIKVAPVNSHIPKIYNIKINNADDLLIAFDEETTFDNNKDYENLIILKDSKGNIHGIIIGDYSKLKDKNHKQKINSTLNSYLEKTNNDFNVKAHLEKRIYYVVRDIIKKITNLSLNVNPHSHELPNP
ncbi:hypothetical protein [Mariniflexile sp. HMF6888]|uniref:hypothetical protein n=1 Tax=Mariniflexile sp. HMF6888 TaxID=3373086 RepID=UPI0037A3D39E